MHCRVLVYMASTRRHPKEVISVQITNSRNKLQLQDNANEFNRDHLLIPNHLYKYSEYYCSGMLRINFANWKKADKRKEVVSPPKRTKIGTQFMSTLRRHRSLKYNTYGSHLFPRDRFKKVELLPQSSSFYGNRVNIFVLMQYVANVLRS